MPQGIYITVTHTGAVNSPLQINDVYPTTDAPYPLRRAGPVYVPVNGSIQMTYTSTVATSFERGSIRGFVDKGYLTASLQFGSGVAAPPQLFPYHINMPDNPNDIVEYRGWAPKSVTLQSVYAYMGTVNNQGAYTLNVINNATSVSCLAGGVPFNMNAIASNTVTNVPLNINPAALSFAPQGRWTITLTSDNIAFNGQDIYIELIFRG